MDVESCSDDDVYHLLHFLDFNPFVNVLKSHLSSVLLEVAERKISVRLIPSAFSKRELSN